METIHRFLSADHDRLDSFLIKAREGRDAELDMDSYEEFRRGLLKHVGMEEIILLPAVKRFSGRPAVFAARVRREHAALTALLVPTPTPRVLEAIVAVLGPHNVMEEGEPGLYRQCEQAMTSDQREEVLSQLVHARDIPPAAHADGPRVMTVIRRALDEAGYPHVLAE